MTIPDATQLSDEVVLADLGRRLTRRRIALDLTQTELARQAGVGKRTLERIEAGESSQTTNLIRVLRALGLLPRLELLVPSEAPSPMAVLRQQGRVRKRVRRSRRSDAPAARPWTWGDER